MYKPLLALSLMYLTTQAAWAADQFTPLENQHCPDVKIISLFPLKIEPIKGWTTTIHEIDPASYAKYGKETPLLDDVRAYENHVVTEYLENYKTSDTVALNSCQYGVHWNKYNTNFSSGEYWISRATRAAINYENYYDTYESLIILSPTTPSTITLSVPSIMNDNYSGWTKKISHRLSTSSFGVWGVWFDCYHDRVEDDKCTWTTVNQTQPIPSSAKDPMKGSDVIHLLP